MIADPEGTGSIQCITQDEVGPDFLNHTPAPSELKVPYVALSPTPDF